MAIQAADKLASEIGRDFSPGTNDSRSTWASASGICSLRVSTGTPAASEARLPNCDYQTTRDFHGTSLGFRWDLDGTSECLTLLEIGLYAKSPMRGCVPASAAIAGTPSIPQVLCSPIFTRAIIDLTNQSYTSILVSEGEQNADPDSYQPH